MGQTAEEWDRQLRLHPDRLLHNYLVRSLRKGFRIGFSHESARCTSAVSNMQSARERPSMIDAFIATKLAMGRVLGPIDQVKSESIHVNSFGLVPKGH